MAFKDDIREVVTDAHAANAPDAANPFLQVATELAEALTTDRVVADLVPSKTNARRLTLRLTPRFQPARGVLILPFWIEPGFVIVAAESTPRFDNRGGFEDYLRDFVRTTAFKDTLIELANQAAQPVEAYLRTLAPDAIARDDLLVESSPETQQALGGAAEGQPVDVELVLSSFPGAGTYREGVTYRFLNSAGLIVAVTRVEKAAPHELRVVGTRA